MIIALLNQKGGCGKTTLAVHLADAYRRSGVNTEILDLDPQRSAKKWMDAGGKVTVQPAPLGSDISTLRMSDVATLINDRRHVTRLLLDCAGRLDRLIAVIERTANLVLIPIRPSPLDIWASVPTAERITAYSQQRGRPVVRFVICQAIEGSHLSRDVGNAVNSLGFSLLESRTHHRVIYANALGRGQTAFDHEPNPATEEIAKLAFEIERMLK